MSDERLKILLIEDDVGDVRLIRELIGGARATRCSTDIASRATNARRCACRRRTN